MEPHEAISQFLIETGALDQIRDAIVAVDNQDKLFERNKGKLFTPLFTTKSKGQGFGLVVVKRMTEALGGSVTYESEVGKGTKFIIRLPSHGNKR